MATQNLYQELRDALGTFKSFLDTNVPTIKPAIQALRSMIPQVDDLLNKLIELMNKLKDEINKLDPSHIPGLAQVSAFTAGVKSLLTTAKGLLPDEGPTIDDVLSVVDVVGSLPSLTDIKNEILSLITAITGHLTNLKAA